MEALTELYEEAGKPKSKKLKGLTWKRTCHRIIIFSDQHRGNSDGSDDFAVCENLLYQRPWSIIIGKSFIL